MTFNHEAIAALPVGGPADAALIRAMCTRRFAYALAASETPGSWIAADAASGVVPLNVIQNNILFAYDSTDSTTINDGVTCLVSSDAKRFKAATIAPPYSVLTKGTTAQPVSPSIGDTYLIPAAATGTDWASKDNQIGIYTAAGWRFATSPIGRLLYVKDETAFYHRAASGTWTAGVGSIALGAGSVNVTNVLGAKASFVVKVENQTTNAPPGSPTTPTAYIIGPSPTGAWAGNAGKLAICLVAGAFTIITPDAGDTVYDKSAANTYRFNGTAWISSAGAWLKFTASPLVTTGGTSVAGSPSETYSASVAPTTVSAHTLDSGTALSYAALKSGATLRLNYRASISTFLNVLLALYRDTETTAIDWQRTVNLTDPINVNAAFFVTTTDAIAHTYKIRVHSLGAGTSPSVDRRILTIEEAA